MNIVAVDIVSAKPIQNVYLEILKENYQQPDEQITDVDGPMQLRIKF